MRNVAVILLFLIVLAAPVVLRELLAHPAENAAASNIGGVERLVVVTPHMQDIRREFARAFDAWHREHYGQGVTIDYRTPGGTEDIRRLLQANYDALRDPSGKLPPEEKVNVGLDVVWGGGDFFFNVQLKPTGVLQPMHLPPELIEQAFPEPTLAGVKLYDYAKGPGGKALPPTWVGVCLSSFGIVYNPDLFRTLGLHNPRTWDDLADPKLAGLVALADPTHSGSAAVAYLMVQQRKMADAEADLLADPKFRQMPHEQLVKNPVYQRAIADGWKRGMSELLLIAANARYFSDSAELVPTDVGNGQAAAGVAIDFYGRVEQSVVGDERAVFISPAGATAITPDPVAILYGCRGKQEELANHFVEFLLSPQGQRLWILKVGEPGGPTGRALRRPPIRRDVYADRTGWTDDVDPFTEAQGFNQRGEWMGLFADTRTIWTAAWIDSRDELVRAYALIRKVPDPILRAQLIEELSDLPVTMQDVMKVRDEAAKRKDDPSLEKWRAMNRIDWANKFRRHYEAVERAAEAQ